MEVHHHPKVEKKNFKEYFLEFIMIFLAVTLGFFAENIREHITEKKQGEIYIKSLIEDLEKDTAQYTLLIQQLTIEDSVTDNIVNCYDTIQHNFQSNSCLKAIIPHLLGFKDFVYNDKTMQELKNAGGLRLINSKAVRDSITRYDALVHRELIHQEGLEAYQQKTIDATNAIINFSAFNQMYSNKKSGDYNIEFLQTNKQAIDNYFNVLLVFKRNLTGQKTIMKNLKTVATGLITYLNSK